MRKGISPLIATVLLIAITMAIAAILATYYTSFAEQQTKQLESTCIGASINYVTADSPKYTDGKIRAVVEAQFSAMGDFKFDVLFDNDTLVTLSPSVQPTGGLAAGSAGTIDSTSISSADASDVNQVRISTNCTNVKTDWSALK